MIEAASSVSDLSRVERRRFVRQAIAVPIDVVVLRSGIPCTIPGRSLDLAQGGVAAIVAGDLRPGESVGLEIKLPFGLEPVQAKAVVRDQRQLCCRFRFVAMGPESRSALDTWAHLTAMRVSPKPEAASTDVEPAQETVLPSKPIEALTPESRRRRQSRKAKWMALSPLLLVLSLVVWWWSWQNGWIGGDQPATAHASSQYTVLTVPSSVMEHSLLHRVDPTYPDEAVKEKTEGLVVVGAIIGTDGAVKRVHTLSGPDVLAQAAMNAVKWWRFQPYEVNGRPAEVQTTIEVDFRLHN